VVAPWLAVRGDRQALRSLMEEVLETLDAGWPSTLDSVPIVRALAAAGEFDLLRRAIESMRKSVVVAAKTQTALLAGDGLLALDDGRAADAVGLLTEAVERERGLGLTYDAACLELDLARAFEAAGEEAAATEARARANAVLQPLGCVNPF
jgi:hypothetical protein